MVNISRLQNIKDTIEDMNKCHQIEILKIFLNNSSVISENSNGTFVNLSYISDTCVDLLEDYISFVNKQDNQLMNIENEKTNIKNEFFKQEKRNVKTKRNKDNINIVLDE